MEQTVQLNQPNYAGFWRRFAAMIIDSVILGALHVLILVPVLGMLGFTAVNSAMNLEEMQDEELALLFANLITGMAALYLVLALIGWLYYALMESGSRQATVGKIAMGLKVTDLHGDRITFMRATGRYFGKIVSSMVIYIGFIIAAFTERKQALHDLMAECLVVSNTPQ